MREPLQLEIHDIAFGGAGVARHEGKVYFIPFTAPGDVVKARIHREKKNFAEGRFTEVLTPSPDRVEPLCAYFGRCGGCAYQHLGYDKQLELKHRQVEQTLRRVGRIAEVPMQPIIPAPAPYAFRNRIRVHVKDGEAGFFAHGSHELVPITRCELAQPGVNDALQDLRSRAARDGDYTLVARDRRDFFEQTNDAVAAELLALVERTVRREQTLLLDAYCGAGFFAHRLAPLFKNVIGIEENEHAVAHANRSAGENERYLVGEVSMLLSELLTPQAAATTTVLLDPPATGLGGRVTDLLLAGAPAEILYISCNPATLARDLAALCTAYRLESVTPLDMFPQTAEIEVLAVLRR